MRRENQPRHAAAEAASKATRNNVKTTCYRVQPAGKGLDHKTTTSNDNVQNGLHVFGCVQELIGGVCGWSDYRRGKIEVVEIECDTKDLRDNGDYEGYLLPSGRGQIVRRIGFKNFAALVAWCHENRAAEAI